MSTFTDLPSRAACWRHSSCTFDRYSKFIETVLIGVDFLWLGNAKSVLQALSANVGNRQDAAADEVGWSKLLRN